MVVLSIFRYQLYFVIYIPELELNESYQVKWHEILNWLNLKQTWIRLETGWQLSVFEMGCDRCCHRKCVESLFYIFLWKGIDKSSFSSHNTHVLHKIHKIVMVPIRLFRTILIKWEGWIFQCQSCYLLKLCTGPFLCSYSFFWVFGEDMSTLMSLDK